MMLCSSASAAATPAALPRSLVLPTTHFDDFRKEEWSTPVGRRAWTLPLPEIEAVVELKRSRLSMSAKQLSKQLVVDIAKARNALCVARSIA
jgi:hypothetical protein